MIEELTEKKLRAYGFNEDTIARILTFENYPNAPLQHNGTYLASQLEQKIYSGKDANRKIYFQNGTIHFPYWDLNLIGEYYELKETEYLNQQKIIAGNYFIESKEREIFKSLEIETYNKILETLNAKPERQKALAGTKEKIDRFNKYLIWLNKTVDGQSKNELKIKKITGFKLLFKGAEIRDFFNELLIIKYIDKGTNFNDFIIVFSGESIININKIRWLNTVTSLLLFIRTLMNKGLIESTKRMDYKKISNCFLDAKGSEFNHSFKELNHSIKNELTPENKEMEALIERYR